MAAKWERSIMDAVDANDADQLDKLLGRTKVHLSLDFLIGKFTPLTTVIIHGHIGIVEKLLFAGASVDFPDGYGTPLETSVYCNNTEACHLLLNRGANVNAINKHQWQALHVAIDSSYYQIARLLLENEAEIFAPESSLGLDSPFTLALKKSRPRFVNLFLDHCEKIHEHLSFKLLFKKAIEELSEECAIAILRRGYYAAKKSSEASKSSMSFFEVAAGYGMWKLMTYMVELNPQLMQEEWLVYNRIPVKLKQHLKFVSWLGECRKQPASLVKLCRSTVLIQLDNYYITKITKLPLPNALQRYLAAVKSAYNDVSDMTD